MAFSKQSRRKRIQRRIRSKVSGSAAKPRLSVYRSNKNIYCQLIDDVNGVTLASASSQTLPSSDGNKVAQAQEVGKVIAGKAKDLNIERMVFDRSGYLYHGRIKALADSVREAGVQI